MRHANAFIILLVILLGCVPLQFSGSNEPTDQTHPLSDSAIAYAESEKCMHALSGDPAADMADTLAYFKDRGVVVHQLETKAWRYATALRGRVLVPVDWPERNTAQKARTLAHERVHYCERDDYRGNDFDRAYALSDNRFKFEAVAYRMSVRAAKLYGASHGELCRYIEGRQAALRDVYWLHDLEPEQFNRETRRIWELELDTPCEQ